EDNVFPHHECEIAQSFGASTLEDPPTSFSRYWVHGRHLLVNGRKMSKSDGTFYTARDLFDPRATGRDDVAEKLSQLGFSNRKVSPAVLRYALVSPPFTQPMNFTFDVLVQSRASVERLQSLYDRLRESAGLGHMGGHPQTPGDPSAEVAARLAEHERAFDDALD